MTKDDKTDLFTARANRLALLSDRVLGAPNEIDIEEAADLLRAANIDSQALKVRFHRRFDVLAKQYAAKGRRVPPLLKRALADLRPGLASSRAERELLRDAQAAIRTLLKRAKELPKLLANLPELTVAAAYRNRKDLSDHDQQVLDELAKRLRDRANDGRDDPRRKGTA